MITWVEEAAPDQEDRDQLPLETVESFVTRVPHLARRGGTSSASSSTAFPACLPVQVKQQTPETPMPTVTGEVMNAMHVCSSAMLSERCLSAEAYNNLATNF